MTQSLKPMPWFCGLSHLVMVMILFPWWRMQNLVKSSSRSTFFVIPVFLDIYLEKTEQSARNLVKLRGIWFRYQIFGYYVGGWDNSNLWFLKPPRSSKLNLPRFTVFGNLFLQNLKDFNQSIRGIDQNIWTKIFEIIFEL